MRKIRLIVWGVQSVDPKVIGEIIKALNLSETDYVFVEMGGDTVHIGVTPSIDINSISVKMFISYVTVLIKEAKIP